MERLAAFLLPQCPIRNQPITELSFISLQAVPYLSRREDIGRLALLNVGVLGFLPVIAVGVPDGEAPIDLGVQNEPRVRGPAPSPCPCLGSTVELACIPLFL